MVDYSTKSSISVLEYRYGALYRCGGVLYYILVFNCANNPI